ncbi:DNA methylase (plasmid) [Streptomyces alboflavus]|uniref:site-specific DNA-methyltransferase (adenine-specific) n=1 Tax=Streptomyces alboflavus TaxID=67267 RepID=A0A291W3Y8_9ACTN|nr:N-6 DNA methylase [Streptomyces alboflavus]ATM24728.1 DNA methylase [Streptomyces alboflavus]
MSTPLPTARTHERLVQHLADDVGSTAAAVSWAHAAALTHHCTRHGMVYPSGPPNSPDAVRTVLAELASSHPSLADLLDPRAVPLWTAPLSRSAWPALRDFLDSGDLTADGPHRVDGYRLGDAYQALSADARKSRALCQTPPWIAELLLELSLEPATDEVGPQAVRMIDPACGTGHILLQAFHSARCYRRRGRAPAPYLSTAASIERALQTVHGVDLDRYAVLLARYRLLATSASILKVRIDSLPRFWPVQVACADSLLDRDEPLLERGRYHAVVGNPPYITVADARQRDLIRKAYSRVAAGKYPLGLPFCQLMFELAVPGGHVAQLTSNAFMKREFGRRFIEQFLPAYDLRMVLDTSGVHIPGHGTPTLILLHRVRAPQGNTVFTVRGVRGEPSIPEDPARGKVWSALAEAVRRRLAEDRLREALNTTRDIA